MTRATPWAALRSAKTIDKPLPAAAGVAAPRHVHVPHEPYTGAELQRTSARPGAYAAADLPSRMGSRLLTPAEMRAERTGALPVHPSKEQACP